MKKFLSIISLSLLLGAMAMPASAQGVSNDNEDEVNKVDQRFGHDFVPGQVLVKMKDGSPASVQRVKGRFKSAGISQLDAVLQEFEVEEMEKLLPNETPGRTLRKAKAFNGDIIQERDLSQLYLLKMNEEKAMDTRSLVERLNSLDEVEFAEPNYKAYIMADVNSFSLEPLFSQLWGLTAINMPSMWHAPIITQKRPVIALLDTGVDITHPDLAANIWTNTAEAEGEEGYDNDNNGFRSDVHGWDFINQTGNIRDFNGHGTHCAGIAAAIGDNSLGVVGANPDALIMPITVMQSDGTGDLATIIQGLDYAKANGADVISMSIGTYATSAAFEQALGRAYQTSILVAAAGNDGRCLTHSHPGRPAPMPMFPAAYNFVLGVQASSPTGLASFSNFDDDGAFFSAYGEDKLYNYELMAPGSSILSTWINGNYRTLNGTSMACPLVAGALSRLIQCKEIDSKEELFGDLIHSKTLAGNLDIYKTYQMSDANRQPSLSFVTFTINESGGDGDGQIDAGEIVEVYPTLRNDWGIASNIQISVELDELEDPNIVEFLDDNVAFGYTLSGYAKNITITPLRLKINETCADNRHIKLVLKATCDNSSMPCQQEFIIIVNNGLEIGGVISEDMTLYDGQRYHVTSQLIVPKGITLTLEPGTILEFDSGANIRCAGKLIAKGTKEKKIIFKGYLNNNWSGVLVHENLDEESHDEGIYYNADSTLFTYKQTEDTPIFEKGRFFKVGRCYYNPDLGYDKNDSYRWRESVYLYYQDFTNSYELLTDTGYISPRVRQYIKELKEVAKKYSPVRTSECTSYFDQYINFPVYRLYQNPIDTLYYCVFQNCTMPNDISVGNSYFYIPRIKDCVFAEGGISYYYTFAANGSIRNNYYKFSNTKTISGDKYSNIVHSTNTYSNFNEIGNQPSWAEYANIIDSYNKTSISSVSNYIFIVNTKNEIGSTQTITNPFYLGTAREDLVRPYMYEMGNVENVYSVLDLSNMRPAPFCEAHGIVWKVVVNGYDAQDEFEQLPPLGVGRHKFEVYFNRPMNVAVAPQISFGVREPYTQHPVAEDGEWSADSTVYTAYYTITGKTKSDGLNRIYVYGAEDDEFFEIPYENTRFNINIQAAGSMATGFMAEAGLGQVSLAWNNDENNFEDAMGFNVYRYNYVEKDSLDRYGRPTGVKIIVPDTVRINQDIVDVEATSFIDYDVKPGETYYYYYKVLSTDLQEYDVSNVVAATPLTGELGDANGSGEVDVADVITTVNYASGQEPKPFIFEAADMNADLSIDILDVIGIIKKIMNPGAGTQAYETATAIYTIEDGTLYVNSPVALAGVQVQLALDKGQEVAVANDLNGFEHTSAWLSDNDYLFLAYNMSGKTLPAGKHALLHIGNGLIAQIRLADSAGHNVEAIGDDATKVNRMATDVMTIPGIYDLQGRKISGRSEWQGQLPKGVYIINGKKVVR